MELHFSDFESVTTKYNTVPVNLKNSRWQHLDDLSWSFAVSDQYTRYIVFSWKCFGTYCETDS